MSIKYLRERWESGEGNKAAMEAIEFLLGSRRKPPVGFGIHEGRCDLRGLVVAVPQHAGKVSVPGASVDRMSGVVQFRDARWEAIDLSHARLPSLRFFDSVIDDCRFDRAVCVDWRLWASEVKNTSMAGSDLRGAAIGTWENGRRNVWRNVAFDDANLQDALVLGSLLEGCSFQATALKGTDFDQVTMRGCKFTGPLKNMIFDGRELPRKPPPGWYTDVDFSNASFNDVEFRGCHFERVTLPDGVYAIPNFPNVERQALKLLREIDTVEASMLRAEFEMVLKWPGRDDSVGVFNRHEYVISGGEPLADLAESVLMEAVRDLGE